MTAKNQPTDPLIDASYTSSFFADEPSYVTAAWRAFIDSIWRDRARPRKKGARKAELSYDSQLAFTAWCRACAQAKADGVKAHVELDVLSAVPSIMPEDDTEWD